MASPRPAQHRKPLASVCIKGKPTYISPEQDNGENFDGRSDLFAVGVMFWEICPSQRVKMRNLLT